MDSEKAALTAVVAHLRTTADADNPKAVALRSAADSLCEAYGILPSDVEALADTGLHFPDVYAAGMKILPNPEPSAAMPAPVAPATAELRGDASSDGFKKFVQRLKSSTGFFEGIEEGSPAYEKRLKRAQAKYESKIAAKRGVTGAGGNDSAAVVGRNVADNGAKPTDVSTISDVDKKEAEAAKEEGNAALKEKNFAAAYTCYNRAIGLDGSNAIYHSNAAAALINMGRFSEAVSSCERAIALDGTYLRARQRLASAYRRLGMFDKEAACLTAAMDIAPDNHDLKEDYTIARRNATSGGGAVGAPDSSAVAGGAAGAPDSSAAGGSGGAPDLSALLGAMGGGGGGGGAGGVDFMSIMQQMSSNPMMQQMMSNPDAMNSMASNPQIAEMMSNPALMQGMMQNMFGGGNPASNNGGGGGGGGT